jgi:hypothetical protein
MAFMFLSEANKTYTSRYFDRFCASEDSICYLCVCILSGTVLSHVIFGPT